MKKNKNQRDNPIVVIDSGVGGLCVLKKLYKAFPYQSFVYLCAENLVPLGNKSVKIIEKACVWFVLKAKRINAKLLIVACNTMSLIGKHIFENCGLPVITVSPIDFLSNNPYNFYDNFANKSIDFCGFENLLFCTRKSAESPAISRLSNICSYRVIILDELAAIVEKNALRLEKIQLNKKLLNLSGVDPSRVNRVYLGCTHYALIKQTFALLFPNAQIYDGTEEIRFKACQYITYSPDVKKPLFKGCGSRRAKKAFYKILQA